MSGTMLAFEFMVKRRETRSLFLFCLDGVLLNKSCPRHLTRGIMLSNHINMSYCFSNFMKETRIIRQQGRSY